MIIDVRKMYPDYEHSCWMAECTVCTWTTKHHQTRDRARKAAAQHLWAKRRQVHKPPELVIGKPSKCPTPTKVRHATRAEAVEHITNLYRHRKGNPDLHPYLCECHAWHVGHSVVSFRKRIRKAVRR